MINGQQTKKNKYIQKEIREVSKYKKYLEIDHNHSLQQNHVTSAVRMITDKFESPPTTLFDYIPNTDCFAADNNHIDCKFIITKETDFFSSIYNDTGYWKDKIAWCYPQYIRKVIIDAMTMFKRRQMKGYLVAPYDPYDTWIEPTKRICKAWCITKKRYYSLFHTKQLPWTCKYDMIFFYFDYQ